MPEEDEIQPSEWSDELLDPEAFISHRHIPSESMSHPAGFPQLATRTSRADIAKVSEVTAHELSRELDLLLALWVRTHAPVEQIRQIEALAETVFGDKDQAAKWLSEPNLATDEKAPITLLGDRSGFDRVKNLLLRIEYGVLA